jgi:hypothetical protein
MESEESCIVEAPAPSGVGIQNLDIVEESATSEMEKEA